jgi:hypothetical protein
MKIPEVRTVSEKYQEIVLDIIEKHPLLDNLKGFLNAGTIKLIFLESTKQKKSAASIVHADCEKIADSKRWAIDADFVITVYAPNVEAMNDEQLKILMLHELMHIGVKEDGNEETYYIVPHDVEDFRAIIDKFGMDWCQ